MIKTTHEIEVRTGSDFEDLKAAVNSVPPGSTVNIEIGSEWVGYGPNEHQEPMIVIRWETYD